MRSRQSGLFAIEPVFAKDLYFRQAGASATMGRIFRDSCRPSFVVSEPWHEEMFPWWKPTLQRMKPIA